MPEYPPALRDNVLALLRRHLFGLTRKEISQTLAYHRHGSVSSVIRDLLAENKIIQIARSAESPAARLVYRFENRKERQ